MSGVLVVMEGRPARTGGREFVRMSMEALAAGLELARQLGVGCAALVMGEDAVLAGALEGRGVERVYSVTHELLQRYTADGYVAALTEITRRLSPQYVVFPNTYQVRDYAPAVAARCRRALIADVIAIRGGGEGGPTFVRQLMRGKLHGEYRPEGDGPCFMSVQAGRFRAETGVAEIVAEASGRAAGMERVEVERVEVTLRAEQIRTRPGERFRAEARTVDLGAAVVIVSVGRGIGVVGEGLAMVRELAVALGAEMAASRPVCDGGLMPMDRLVGSSGQTVAPKLYLAVGISGAIQHLVGMKGAKTVIAINRDESAPIFEVADVGVVGNLFEIVPELTRAVLAAKAKG